MGSWGGRGLVARRRLVDPGRSKADCTTQGLQCGEIKPQTSDWKHPWGLRLQQEKLPGEVVGETHRDLECAQAHPLGNQQQRGPI